MTLARDQLNVRRELINTNFEGYKLSLDSLPIYVQQLENGIASVELTDEQFSYHHVKLFGVHNLLLVDLWNMSDVYIIDKDWNVVKATAHDTSLEYGTPCFTIPDASTQQLVPARYNAQLQFVSPDRAVIGDGAGKLHIVDTGNRAEGNNHEWRVLVSTPVPEDTCPGLLVDAVEMGSAAGNQMDCLLVHVVSSSPEEKDKYRSQFLTVLTWLTFTSVDRTSWTVSRTRRLVSRKPFSYASLGRDGASITIAGEAEFYFTQDTEIPIVSEEEVEKTENRPPDYTWHQTMEDLTVQFTVPSDVTKADIYLTLTRDHVEFGIKNGPELLKGGLHDCVDTHSSTWTIEGQRLDLVLMKDTECLWPLVVNGDTRGELLVDPSEAAAIHERLAHLTSEEWNADPTRTDKPYNVQELEECDAFPDDDFMLLRLDGTSHKLTHKTNIGSNQWLFNAHTGHDKSPALCLRYDVDGLLLQPELSPRQQDIAWTHCATFNAFGYVQASKQGRKFTSCPPDCSYVVICDTVRHMYVYRQSCPVTSPIRNRKTGQEVSAIAKQQVISLEAVDNIVGLQATNDKLFVATESKLHFIKI